MSPRPRLRPFDLLAFLFKPQTNSPWAVMVHLPHTTSHLTAMVCSIGLKLTARGAIYRSSVGLADKHILGIETLQSCGIQRESLSSNIILEPPFEIWVTPISFLSFPCSFPPTFPLLSSSAALGAVSLFLVLKTWCAPGKIARIPNNIIQKSEIRSD